VQFQELSHILGHVACHNMIPGLSLVLILNYNLVQLVTAAAICIETESKIANQTPVLRVHSFRLFSSDVSSAAREPGE
jgi:hypothetical protein